MTVGNEIVKMNYYYKDSESWMIEREGHYASIIQNYLVADGIPDEGVKAIMQNAARVLGYCPSPTNNSLCEKTGIVIGKVQSGKTSNFISLAALAFDNNYSLVVVFGGTKKPLVKQNSDRIKEYFAAAKDVIVLNTNEFRSQLTEPCISQFINMGRKIIIVALKSPNQINYISDNIFIGTFLSEQPTLIIDDEGDEASLNTLVAKGKKSPTYLAIEGLKRNLHKHCFISVTATPQANILIDSLNVLSPDFGVLVDPGYGYCGLDVFHGADSKYTIQIPRKEMSLLDEGIPNSFIEALSMFFVACAIFKKRGMLPGDKLSMLIHPSQLKADHTSVYMKTETLIKTWRDSSKNKNDIAFIGLRKNLLAAYKTYEADGTENLPSFDIIENLIVEAINFCGLHKVNGDSVPNGADELYDFNIYVGGTMLGRGLTLKGLAITYIIRTAKGVSAVDTVQQRARWFGYKSKYINLCRIFAAEKIIKEFRLIRDHEEDLWDTVREANLQGTRFKNIPRIFLLSDDMKMTRTSVAKTENYSFHFWNLQREFQNDPEYIKSNVRVLEEFRAAQHSQLTQQQFGAGTPFVLLKSALFDEVKTNLLGKFIFPTDSKLNAPLIHKLATLLYRKNITVPIDIIWMRDGETSKHKIVDGAIPNYMVGRRPDDKSKPAIYNGDRYEFVKDDTMQLQIHTIEDTATGIISPTLALYIPKSCVEALTNLVIKVRS